MAVEDTAVTCASPFLSLASLTASAANLPPISDATGSARDLTPPGGGGQPAALRSASKRLSGPPAGFYWHPCQGSASGPMSHSPWPSKTSGHHNFGAG